MGENGFIRLIEKKSLLGGDTIKDIGKIVDDLHTSGEEGVKRLHRYYMEERDKQVSARWGDLKHGSWLSKNIRPITLF